MESSLKQVACDVEMLHYIMLFINISLQYALWTCEGNHDRYEVVIWHYSHRLWSPVVQIRFCGTENSMLWGGADSCVMLIVVRVH